MSTDARAPVTLRATHGVDYGRGDRRCRSGPDEGR